MKIKSEYVLREVADEMIVVPTGSEAVNFNGIISLNKSGARLFRLLNEEQTKSDLVSFLLNTYDVSEEKAIKDVELFIEKLERHHILENS